MSRAIAGGLAKKIPCGPTLPAAAEPFSLFVLTADPAHPVLCICAADGSWVRCALQ
jgi:hypothetical protein